MSTISEEIFWACKECDKTGEWHSNDVYPKGWTCEDKYGLICSKCSRGHGLKAKKEVVHNDWDDL